MKKYILHFFIVSIVANIISLYYFYDHNKFHENNKYPLLSKRIFVRNQNDIIINFVPLRKAIREYINSQKNEVGVYFEYLPSGVSIGVNDREEVRIASLSKVPLAMSVMRKIERGGLRLTDEITLKKEDLDPKFGSLWKKGEGSRFTVEELIRYMLADADNTAYEALFRTLSPEEIMEVYSNLEIELSSIETNPTISPKSFSSIFRSLYLASFLSEDNSNYILNILTRTNFIDKIPAGVPNKDIKIAHKIGVFSRHDSEEKLFTDCGIIYVPERPYLLCVFVKESEDEAKKHISYLSYMVYSYIIITKGGI